MFLNLCWIWSKKTSVGSFYKENIFKPCLTKQLLNVFKLWCEQGIRLSFMLGGKYVNKMYYFQGLRVLKCHRTKHLNCMNFQSRWPLQKTFFSLTPPLPPGFPESLIPPSTRISIMPSVGGCGFFLEQPNGQILLVCEKLKLAEILSQRNSVINTFHFPS